MLLFLLARFPGQFFLLSRLMIVRFGHELSGVVKLWNCGPEQKIAGAR